MNSAACGRTRATGARTAAALVALPLLGLPLLRTMLARHVAVRYGRPQGRRGTGALIAVPDATDVSLPGPGGAVLRGWFLPGAATGEQRPAALVMHGWGSSALDLVPLAEPLREAGLHTLLLDARGHGRSDDCTITSMPHFADDVAAGLHWLRANPLVDPDRIVLVGHSVGAGACLLAAHRDPDVAAVVSLSCMAQPREVMTRLLSGAHVPRPARWLALRYVEHTIGMRFEVFAPLLTLPALRAPVLLVHGELDDVVPVSDAYQLAAAAPGTRLLVVPATGHADIEAVPAVSAALRDFVTRIATVRPVETGRQPDPETDP